MLDDGELDRVQELLQRLGLDWTRCLEECPQRPLERPRDLLITSGPRAMRMPELVGDSEPVWLVIYDQDFLPLRDRLRALGVHYLVSGELKARGFELFLQQLLHGGDERRARRRVPLRAEIEIEVGFERRKAALLELSDESCVFLTETQVPAERRVIVRLPEVLTGREPFELEGRVARAAGQPSMAGLGGVTTVLRFAELDADGLGRIHDLLGGYAPGTQVTPLLPEPGAVEESAWEGDALVHGTDYDPMGPPSEIEERRTEPRSLIEARVDAIRWPGGPSPKAALGRDLSLRGVRIGVSPLPRVGSSISLAIYTGAAREEPLLVEGRVLWAEGEEAGLSFSSLTPDQTQRLGRFLEARPAVEHLEAPGASLHVTEILPD